MMRNPSTKFGQAVLAAASLLALTAACAHEAADTNTDASAWVPSAEEEAFYEKRFNILLEAFASGAATTEYDTLAPVLGAGADSAVFPVAENGLDPETVAAITSYAAANNSQALIVYHRGKIVHETYFQDMDESSLIVGKSLAKPLGVVAVGRAIQAGKIDSLDQPVSDFITEWKDTDKAGITIRHLLQMRSGLLPQGAAPELENVLNRAYLHPSHDQVIIHEYPLTHEPGSRYEYSNANAELVAPLIERATGVEYEDWIADEVLTPIGAKGGQIWMNKPDGTAHSGCCVLLPARSWLRLAKLVMDGGEWEGEPLLPEGYTTEMATPTAQNQHTGMGVYIGQPYVEYRGYFNPEIEFGKTYHSAPFEDEDLILFDGNSNQVIYMIPSKDLIVLRLGDTPPKDPAWDNSYLPNLVSKAITD